MATMTAVRFHNQGDLKRMLDAPFPSTAGQDLAGVVEGVGEGVTALQPGDAV